MSERFDLIINAATPSVPNHGGNDSTQILNSAINGTENLVALAEENKCFFLNLSSGIVSKRLGDIELDLTSAGDAYLYGKRESEKIVAIANQQGRIAGINLRLYAFAGPGISLKDHFAVGNFLNDARERRPISIKGNPETKRSYLYPTDLVSNVVASVTSRSSQTLEIGSHLQVSMQQLAGLVNEVTGNKGINKSADYGAADAYFPVANNLLREPLVDLKSAILRWNKWLG
jgi:dTDP-glucose 4,6-dehydratase